MMPSRQTITKDELRRSNRAVIVHLVAVIAWLPVFYFFIRPLVPEWLGITIFGIVFWWCLWVIGTSCVGIFRRPRVIDNAGSNQSLQPTAGRADDPRMKSDEPEQTKFVWLGRYSPHEASKLLERFEQVGIAFRAQPLRAGYGGSNGPTVSLDISVDPARGPEVDQIHRDLFSDGLPNYESSFFRDHRNV